MNKAPAKVSRRELEVAKLVAEGLTSKEIGQRLFIAERTVEGHIDSMFNKLEFRSRAQLAAWVSAEAARKAAIDAPSEPQAAAEPESRSAIADAPRRNAAWIWLSGGAVATIGAGVVIVTLVIPALSPPVTGPIIDTYAGTGISSISADNDPARSTNIISPSGLALDGAGDLLFIDGNRVRVVGKDGRVQTIAGSGTAGFSGDGGSPLEADVSILGFLSAEAVGLVVDRKGDVFFSDTLNDRVREVTTDGRIITVAGSGVPGQSEIRPPPADVGDGGPALKAVLAQPRGLALDIAGNLYIADTEDNRVRKVDPAGIITTFAGNGVFGFSGDGGPAIASELSAPEGLAIDAQDNLYISDTANDRVRKVSAGVIATIAGDGVAGFSGDGKQATSAALNLPLGLAIDNRGNLYIVDGANNRVRKVDLGGIITTVAGAGPAGFGGDSRPATSAELNQPAAVAVSNAGDLYIGDAGNNRIRVVHLFG